MMSAGSRTIGTRAENKGKGKGERTPVVLLQRPLEIDRHSRSSGVDDAIYGGRWIWRQNGDYASNGSMPRMAQWVKVDSESTRESTSGSSL
jgi:hypothetical protein